MKQRRGYSNSPANKENLNRRIAFLKQVLPFTDLSDEDLALIAQDFYLKKYKKDEIIFRQRDRSRRLYLVTKGKVRIYKISPAGGETTLNIFSTNDIIGELAAIDGRPRSATAKAINHCALLDMRADIFLERMREMTDLAMGITRLLASKIRWTADYAQAVAQYDAAGRLLHILLRYNQQFGQADENGKGYVLDLSLNQTDLASLIGARREWVNRILRDWRNRELIKYEAGKIIILDLARVEAERDSRIEANISNW